MDELVPHTVEVGTVLLQTLPSLVQLFTTTLQEIVDEALEGTNVLNDERFRRTTEARNIRRSIRAAVRDALRFMDKIDDFATLVLQRNDVARVQREIRNQNYALIEELRWQISQCLNQATEIHRAFQANCDAANNLCTTLVELCSSSAHRARNQRRRIQIGGGIGSGAALASSIGVGVGGMIASIIAGVFTGGAGAVVGLPLTAAATLALGGTGIAGAVATAMSAEEYERIASRFSQLSNSLISMRNIADNLITCIYDVNTALTNRQETSDEIIHWLEHDRHVHTEAICSALDRLVVVCRRTQECTSPCREVLRNLQDRLQQLHL